MEAELKVCMDKFHDGTKELRRICAMSTMINGLFCHIAPGGDTRMQIVTKLVDHIKTEYKEPELHPQLDLLISAVLLRDSETESNAKDAAAASPAADVS